MSYMNQQVFKFLNVYATIPSPQYAILLRGKWGCGKTFFIKRWLSAFEGKGKHPADEDCIELKPIYVSLFGMKCINDIKVAIDRSVNPFFYSKKGKALKNVWRIVSKIAFKTELDLDDDGKSETSFSGTLDSLSLFSNSDEKDVSGVRFLIFDDVERCQIQMKQLLGFINYFVEHCDCHVVVVGEEQYLENNDLLELQNFKEKVVGREFEIKPDIDSAVDSFVHLPMMDIKFLAAETDTIRECFICTGYNNLRLLRQSLLDFSLLLLEIPNNLVDNNKEYFHSLLCSYIAVYAEFRNKNSHDLLLNWEESYSSALFGSKDNAAELARSIMRKYSRVEARNMFDVLNPTLNPRIIQQLESGENLAPMFIDILARENRELTAIERLGYFWDKSNQEFDGIYDNLVKELTDGTIKEPVSVGKALAYLAYFDNKGIKEFPLGLQDSVRQRLQDMLSSCHSLLELNKCSSQFSQGYNFVTGFDYDKAFTKDIIKSFWKLFEQLKQSLPDEMQVELRKLSDSNVDRLLEIDNISYPDQSSTYKMRPIFEKENPSQLCNALCSLSNKGRNTFSAFLASHYDFQSRCSFANEYKPDSDVLKKLRELLADASKSKVSIEKMSFERLLKNMDKAIQRCEGAEVVEQ